MKVPGVPFIQGRNRYGTSTKYGIAVHATDNTATARAEASYATRRTDGTSAHFYIDSQEVIQSLDTDDRAGHAGSTEGNTYAIALEFTGLARWSRAQWLNSIAWDETARVLALLSKHHQIPAVRVTVEQMRANPRVRGAYDHNQMRLAWGGTDHTDPGPNFPWDHLLRVWQDKLKGENMPSVRDIWLSTEADLIQRYTDDGQKITTGNTHMTAGFALGWAVREATLARHTAARVDEKLDKLIASINEIANRGTSLDTAIVLEAVKSLRSALATGAQAEAKALTQD